LSSADALRTLARIFAQPLAAEEVETLASADHVLSQALREDGAHGGPTPLGEALAEEFTRLFEGPVGRHPPLAGLACGDDEFLGPRARELIEAYRSADLEPDPTSGLLPDHLSVELDFVATLLERGQAKDAAEFVARHMANWVPAWIDGVGAATGMEFYRVAGSLLQEAIQDLREPGLLRDEGASLGRDGHGRS